MSHLVAQGTFQSLIKTIVPFLILVLTKSIFQHFIYGLILIGLNLLAIRLNSFIIRQVQLKRQVSYVKCFYTIGLILALYSLLINLFSRIDPVDPYLSLLLTGRPRADGNLSWLVWLVIFGDTVIKLLAIGIKCIILITSSKLGCLFKRVEVTCRDDDLLHWMSTYGTHPGTGHPIIKLPGGDGHTSMSINIF